MVNKRWKYVLSDLVVITQGLASDIVLVSLICIHMYMQYLVHLKVHGA